MLCFVFFESNQIGLKIELTLVKFFARGCNDASPACVRNLGDHSSTVQMFK